MSYCHKRCIMNKNNLCPQDYSFMVLHYLNGFRCLLEGANVSKITKYCIKKSKSLDPGDEVKIKNIVETTLTALTNHGYLCHVGGEDYNLVKCLDKLDIVVFDEVRPKINYNKANLYLKGIDERTQYKGQEIEEK